MNATTFTFLTSDTIARIISELDSCADQLTANDWEVMRTAAEELFHLSPSAAISLLSAYDVNATNPVIASATDAALAKWDARNNSHA